MLRRLFPLFVLSIVALLIAVFQVNSQVTPGRAGAVPATQPAQLSVSGPYTSENLSIWLVRGPDRSGGKKYLTLSEAMEQKKLVVHETGNVNQLAVENVSDETVFIPAGSIVKGGRQDRTLGSDLIIGRADGKVPIDAFCVEHGRWSKREGEDARQFSGNYSMSAGKAMKYSGNSNAPQPDQSAVWESVAMSQANLRVQATAGATAGDRSNMDPAAAVVADPVSPSSFQLTLETDSVKKLIEQRRTALKDAAKNQADVIGYVYAVNNEIAGGNVYASPQLFQKLWPMLLDAAAVESVSDAPTTQPSAKPAPPIPPLPSNTQVVSALGDREKLTATREVNGRTTVHSYDRDDSILLDTTDKESGSFVCRSLLVKPDDARKDK